jgi:hypothetical protein
MAKEILQQQPMGKPHTQKKFQGTATSMGDAIVIFRDLNLS